MSKVIGIYNEEERAGSTTIAISLAIICSWYANKKTLLINYSKDGAMEQYLSDIEVKYGLDYVKALADDLCDIKAFTTQINDNLSVIGCGNQEDNDRDFIDKLLIRAGKEYEVIIFDISNAKEEYLKSKASLVLGVTAFDIKRLNFKEEENLIILFNAIPQQAKESIKDVIERKVKKNRLMAFDTNVWYQVSMRNSIYSYLVENINSNSGFIQDQLLIAEEILNEEIQRHKSIWGSFISLIRKEESNEF